MTGGEAIVRALLQQGVDTVFGIPGVQTYGLYDALAGAAGEITVYGARHEQTCGYMAFGYARSTGKVGVYSVVPGPGVLNSAAALCTAYGASTPVVCITSEIPSEYIGRGKGHLHELPDQLATLRTLTKWAAKIDHPGDAPALVAEAFRQATSGRPRPVALEMPWDVMEQDEEVSVGEPSRAEPPPRPDPAAVAAAVERLASATRPMMMVGSGATGASREVRDLAELLQAPVVPFRSGRGIVGDDVYLGFTCASGFPLWRETDLLLGIGSRLELEWFRWASARHRPASTVTVDVDPQQVDRLEPDVGIVGDAADGVQALLDGLRDRGHTRSSRRDELEAVRAGIAEATRKVAPYIDHLAAIRRALPRDGFLVEEICQAGFTSYFGFPAYEPRTFVSGGHQGTLGFGFPTALGVKAGNPDRAVVSITGDGGFQFGLQELATAVQHDLGLVTVLFNNNAYGNVLRDQRQRYDGRVIGAELENPDFLALAASYGVAARRATTPDELEHAVGEALRADAPALVEVPIEPGSEVSPWEFLNPPAADE
jgi:acetolactate synthase-1/2/3 large subunit